MALKIQITYTKRITPVFKTVFGKVFPIGKSTIEKDNLYCIGVQKF